MNERTYTLTESQLLQHTMASAAASVLMHKFTGLGPDEIAKSIEDREMMRQSLENKFDIHPNAASDAEPTDPVLPSHDATQSIPEGEFLVIGDNVVIPKTDLPGRVSELVGVAVRQLQEDPDLTVDQVEGRISTAIKTSIKSIETGIPAELLLLQASLGASGDEPTESPLDAIFGGMAVDEGLEGMFDVAFTPDDQDEGPTMPFMDDVEIDLSGLGELGHVLAGIANDIDADQENSV